MISKVLLPILARNILRGIKIFIDEGKRSLERPLAVNGSPASRNASLSICFLEISAFSWGYENTNQNKRISKYDSS